MFSTLGACAAAPPAVSLKCPELAVALPPLPTNANAQVATPTPHVDRTYDFHVYRLDFVLNATDPTAAQNQTTSFSLTLGEHDRGDIVVGKNVALTAASSGGTTNITNARQDVGVKVVAQINTVVGDDVMLDVSTEVSALEATNTIRKVSTMGKALAAPGKSTVVAMLQEDRKRYELSVTPTKIR